MSALRLADGSFIVLLALSARLLLRAAAAVSRLRVPLRAVGEAGGGADAPGPATGATGAAEASPAEPDALRPPAPIG